LILNNRRIDANFKKWKYSFVGKSHPPPKKKEVKIEKPFSKAVIWLRPIFSSLFLSLLAG
jgi:hypothetical protein